MDVVILLKPGKDDESSLSYSRASLKTHEVLTIRFTAGCIRVISVILSPYVLYQSQ